MGVYQHDGHWRVDIRHKGKRHRPRSPLDTKAGAKAYDVHLRGRLAQGETIDDLRNTSPDLTFGEFAERWFKMYVVTNNKPSEQYGKRRVLDRHLLPRFGRKRLDDIGAKDVEAFKAAQLGTGFSAKSVNNQLAVLGKCLRIAVEWDELRAAPRLRPLKTISRRVDFLSLEEVAAVLSDETEPMWNCFVRMAIRTGMRAGELAALRWEDVNMARRLITIQRSCWRGTFVSPKSHRIRSLPVSSDLAEALEALPRRHELVFVQDAGTPIADRVREHALRRIARRVQVRPFGAHLLRHTFASHLAMAGVPLPVVQALMGHSTITTTMRYAHLAQSAFDQAAQVLEMQRQWEARTLGHPVGTARHGAPVAA